MMPALPANLPSVARAKLPEVYQKAKTTLAECSRLDECRDWANKSEALASYAKQAGDTDLRKMADRIQARAILRCGELLREFKTREKGRNCRGVPTISSAAREAGMSRDQKITALRVANVPKEEFEIAVESEDPPTITALAERGTTRSLVDLKGREPKEFAASTEAQGHLRRFAEMAGRISPGVTVRGAFDRERLEILEHAEMVADWIQSLIVDLRKE